MTTPFLTPREVMALLKIRSRGTLDRMVQRGILERFNVSGGTKQARWRYKLKPLEPDKPEPSIEDVLWADLKRRLGDRS